jgi:hypothetical protein
MYRQLEILTLSAIVSLSLAQHTNGWSEAGHHLIAALAYQELSPIEQQALIELLKSHPQFEKEFLIPQGISSAEEARLWLMGRAGYWPDVARRYREYNNPKWHYQLGSILVIGNVSSVEVPATPTGLPKEATMRTKELHIAQAIKLATETLGDQRSSRQDKSLAICWIAHLVADAHQPCHSGSLYAEIVFPKGDRGANSIPTKQSQNMHSLWDGLLGRRYTGAVRRRMFEIATDEELETQVTQLLSMGDPLSPEQWLTESRHLAVRYVYTPDILERVLAAQEAGVNAIAKIELTRAFLKNAGRVAQRQALLAARRLSRTWSKALHASVN